MEVCDVQEYDESLISVFISFLELFHEQIYEKIESWSKIWFRADWKQKYEDPVQKYDLELFYSFCYFCFSDKLPI